MQEPLSNRRCPGAVTHLGRPCVCRQCPIAEIGFDAPQLICDERRPFRRSLEAVQASDQSPREKVRLTTVAADGLSIETRRSRIAVQENVWIHDRLAAEARHRGRNSTNATRRSRTAFQRAADRVRRPSAIAGASRKRYENHETKTHAGSTAAVVNHALPVASYRPCPTHSRMVAPKTYIP